MPARRASKLACIAAQLLIIASTCHAATRQWHIAGTVNTEGERAGIKVSGHPFGPETTTDASGKFRLIWQSSPVHTEAIVVARHSDGKRVAAVLLNESHTSVELTLQEERKIQGRVIVGENGAEGINVRVSVRGKRYASEVPGLIAVTGPSGEFQVIAPGNVKLELLFEKTGHSRTERQLQAGGDVVVPDVVLRVCKLSISGRVTTAFGKPLNGAPVVATAGDSDMDQALRHSTTDANGEFKIDGLCSGDVRITVYSPTSGFPLATVNRQLPTDKIEITVPDK